MLNVLNTVYLITTQESFFNISNHQPFSDAETFWLRPQYEPGASSSRGIPADGTQPLGHVAADLAHPAVAMETSLLDSLGSESVSRG